MKWPEKIATQFKDDSLLFFINNKAINRNKLMWGRGVGYLPAAFYLYSFCRKKVALEGLLIPHPFFFNIENFGFVNYYYFCESPEKQGSNIITTKIIG